jgi:hypothetical protein
MKPAEAQRVVEELRKGIPPIGYTKHFTVGRDHEIKALEQSLHGDGAPVLLLQANYGSGKSHLLRYIRDHALAEGYAVSFVTLDAKSGVRFNRMDQIMGAILRNIEIPPHLGPQGLRGVLDFVCSSCANARSAIHNGSDYWKKLTNGWKWDFSETLASPGMFVALRAYSNGGPKVQEKVIDWLQQPENFRNQKKQLQRELVEGLRAHFRDPRTINQLYEENAFTFHTDGYRSVWGALKDVDSLLVASGLRGLIILFDEFEDVLTNLNNIQHKESAFWNLFLFMGGQRFPGRSFYAVTPEFSIKCKNLMIERGRYDFDFERFDKLPTFAMSPLSQDELTVLAQRILNAHAQAFGYQPESVSATQIRDLVAHLSRSPIQDRARHTIREVVKLLDTILEDS